MKFSEARAATGSADVVALVVNTKLILYLLDPGAAKLYAPEAGSSNVESSSLDFVDSVIVNPTRPVGVLEYASKTTVFALLKQKNPPTKNTPESILITEPFATAFAIPEAPVALTVFAVMAPPSIVIVSPSVNVSADK